jgi:cell division septation protein DedD
MVMDYRERKAVPRNRPRRQPAGIFFFSIFVAVIIAYTLGLVTGWLVFRPGGQKMADSRSVSTEVNSKGVEVPAESKGQAAPENTGNIKEPMLTFYETLPKGNRELIGSGLNLPKPLEPAAPKAAPVQKPAPVAKEAPTAQPAPLPRETAKVPVKSAETTKGKETPAGEAAVKEDNGKGKFVVQVASYHVRKEAEELRDRIKSGGLNAYIVESNLPEKGTFYRVRIGRHLDQKAAQELAEKAGKGSIVIPE